MKYLYCTIPRSFPLAPLAKQGLLFLCLVELGYAIPEICVLPNCPTGCAEGSSWSTTNRTDVLVTSWNSPVDGGDIMTPAPTPEGVGPIQVSLSQNTIDNAFFGIININIEGLSLGQTVLLEKFNVDNDQGLLNANAVLQESYLMTDGVAAMRGEVFNFNLVNDITPRDGKITGQLDFWEPNTASIANEYVYRVSSPLNSFPAQSTRLTVTSVVTSQKYTGKVMSGGAPVAGAIVALLNPLGDQRDFINGVVSDENGNYVLYTPEFEDDDTKYEFDVTVIKPGYVGSFGEGMGHVIQKNQDTTLDLSLEQGTRTVSGTLLDSEARTPIAGVEVFLFPVDEKGQFVFSKFTAAWTNAQGVFSTSVLPGRWGAMVRPSACYRIGYVSGTRTTALSVADASDGDVSNFEVPLKKATSVIWGELVSETLLSDEPDTMGEPLPLCGVEVFALNPAREVVWAVTDGDGCYRLAVTPGRWNVAVSSASMEEVEHCRPTAGEVGLTAPNQSHYHPFVARELVGTVSGFVTDEDVLPVGRLVLGALNLDLDVDEGNSDSTYESDGYYSIDLPEGDWKIFPNPEQASALGVIFEDLPEFTIESGVSDDLELDIDVIEPTSTIELTSRDANTMPISGALLHASATIGGFTYDSFAVADDQGVARIPALEGLWTIHTSASFLRTAGMESLPELQIQVTGATTTISQQATSLTRAPAVLSTVVVDDDVTEIQGTGQSGERYRIEVSRDLKTWLSIGTPVAADGKFEVIDESGTEGGKLYYRAVIDDENR